MRNDTIMQRLQDLFQMMKEKYRIEIILIAISTMLAVLSALLFFSSDKKNAVSNVSFKQSSQKQFRSSETILAEISGAVGKPGVYRFSSGARLNDLLEKSEGLSEFADKEFFARNFNRARYISDQEKIYIPSTEEVAKGVFLENQRVIDLTGANQSQNALISNPVQEKQRININIASLDELDSLPGVGKTTAQKITDTRPYSSINQLVEKKVLKQSVFDQIKDSIATQ